MLGVEVSLDWVTGPHKDEVAGCFVAISASEELYMALAMTLIVQRWGITYCRKRDARLARRQPHREGEC